MLLNTSDFKAHLASLWQEGEINNKEAFSRSHYFCISIRDYILAVFCRCYQSLDNYYVITAGHGVFLASYYQIIFRP
jgi:hypothetical protein